MQPPPSFISENVNVSVEFRTSDDSKTGFKTLQTDECLSFTVSTIFADEEGAEIHRAIRARFLSKSALECVKTACAGTIVESLVFWSQVRFIDRMNAAERCFTQQPGDEQQRAICDEQTLAMLENASGVERAWFFVNYNLRLSSTV